MRKKKDTYNAVYWPDGDMSKPPTVIDSHRAGNYLAAVVYFKRKASRCASDPRWIAWAEQDHTIQKENHDPYDQEIISTIFGTPSNGKAKNGHS